MYLDIICIFFEIFRKVFCDDLKSIFFLERYIMTNFRSRALAVLKGEKPDRLPWFADLSWWVLAEKQKKTLDPRYEGHEGFVNLHSDLNTGLYLPLVWPYKMSFDCAHNVERDGLLEIHSYETPKGTLTEVRKHMPESFTWSYDKHMVESASDLPAFRYFIESHQFEPDVKEADKIDRLYGEQGIPVIWVPRTPLSRFMVEMAGVETTVYALVEDPEGMKETFELMRRKDDEPYQYAAEASSELVMIADNLSSEIVSPNFFREYSLDYYQSRSQQSRETKK